MITTGIVNFLTSSSAGKSLFINNGMSHLKFSMFKALAYTFPISGKELKVPSNTNPLIFCYLSFAFIIAKALSKDCPHMMMGLSATLSISRNFQIRVKHLLLRLKNDLPSQSIDQNVFF
jgi:hypothetical protein